MDATAPAQVQRDGTTHVSFANGDTYDGLVDAKTGLASGGFGVYRYAATGDEVRGAFVDGVAQGAGELVRANGDAFRGSLARDEVSEGTYEYADEANAAKRFRGRFRVGLPSGVGALEFRNGDAYEGAFEMGRPHGAGVYTYANGDHLTGAFVGGRPTHGALVFAGQSPNNNGAPGRARYLGEFSGTGAAPRFHGSGRLEFSNGDAYEGGWADGAFEGEGAYTFAGSGVRLACSRWRADAPGGRVDVAFPDGARFVGALGADGGLASGLLVRGQGAGAQHLESLDLRVGGFLSTGEARATRVWVEGECVGAGRASSPPHAVVASAACLGLSPRDPDVGRARAVLAADQVVRLELSRCCSGDKVAWVEPDAPGTEAAVLASAARGVVEGRFSSATCLVGCADASVVARDASALLGAGLPTVRWRPHLLRVDASGLPDAEASAVAPGEASDLGALRELAATRVLARLQTEGAAGQRVAVVVGVTPGLCGDAGAELEAARWFGRELARCASGVGVVVVLEHDPAAVPERAGAVLSAMVRALVTRGE